MPQPVRKSWFARNLLWVIPVLILLPLLCCGGGVGIIFTTVVGAMKSSDPFQESLAAVQGNAEVRAELGTPIEADFFVTGNIQTSPGSGTADISYGISGPQGSGRVHVAGTKSGGEWDYSVMEATISGRKGWINLRSGP